MSDLLHSTQRKLGFGTLMLALICLCAWGASHNFPISLPGGGDPDLSVGLELANGSIAFQKMQISYKEGFCMGIYTVQSETRISLWLLIAPLTFLATCLLLVPLPSVKRSTC